MTDLTVHQHSHAAQELSPAALPGAAATWKDYVALLKPRVMTLVVFSAFAGLYAAPGTLHPFLALTAILCIAVGAGAAGAINMWYDRDIDQVMARTRGRPIPRGRIAPDEALAFGVILSVASVMIMGLAVGWLAAALLALASAFYVFVYTIWLKRRTPQNIVIGGAAGAFPPMIGQAAVTGTVTLDTVILFAIIFIWTPPHFWALALVKSGDYARAGIPMLPNVHGPDATRRQILLYTLLLAPVGILPALTGFGGMLYLGVSVITGIWMLLLALRVYRRREGEAATKACWSLFGFSIVYLFGLFAVLIVEHGLGLIIPVTGG